MSLWDMGGWEAPQQLYPLPPPSLQPIAADSPLRAGGPADVVGRVPGLRVLHPLRHRAHRSECPPPEVAGPPPSPSLAL